MGIFKLNYKKVVDDKYLYFKFFVDLEGNPIYAKRKKEIKKDDVTTKEYREGDYQDHDELAADIVSNNPDLKALRRKLFDNYWQWIGSARSFLLAYGYVSVDGLDNTKNCIQYDSVTTPKKIIDMMDQDDPIHRNFDRFDVGEPHATWTKEECEELDSIHRIILEERRKLEQSKKTTYHGNEDEGR